MTSDKVITGHCWLPSPFTNEVNRFWTKENRSNSKQITFLEKMLVAYRRFQDLLWTTVSWTKGHGDQGKRFLVSQNNPLMLSCSLWRHPMSEKLMSLYRSSSPKRLLVKYSNAVQPRSHRPLSIFTPGKTLGMRLNIVVITIKCNTIHVRTFCYQKWKTLGYKTDTCNRKLDKFTHNNLKADRARRLPKFTLALTVFC